ncbi:hypothetical protein EXIGLDRAFT_762360 [Exidia glandulosa HHB12029]|uniref:Protein kinase domain-containing protein n=1 Tax=Exidia glandulosa HHB12029 TaxID=1314781 RepID=A0A165MSK1_EXIGL|nr:hypothetical protein EXIGLDRAFT_762360 [Exidia glandulosa HHB12029]
MSKDPETFPMPMDPFESDGVLCYPLPSDLTWNPSYKMFGLRPSESFWRERVPFLRAAGYSLRRRYQPHWYPTWPSQGMESIYFEDSWQNLTHMVIDAYRREDASLVAIKCRPSASVENELAIHRFLSSNELRQDPNNHCAPLLDVFHDPEAWPFETVDNALDFARQTLEAIDFLHAHGVAHRDCSASNIRVDASELYKDRWPHPVLPSMDYSHPWGELPAPSRASAPVRYFLIDFGESTRVPDGYVGQFLVTGDRTIDPELPEVYFDHPYDPFPVDIFLLGNVYKHSLLESYLGLDMIRSLVEAMTRLNPSDRPDIRSALAELGAIYEQSSWITLHSRLWRAEASIIESVARDVPYVASQTLGFARSMLA